MVSNYAHVMQLVRWRFSYLPHAYANLRDLPQKHRTPVSMPAYPARPLQLILTLNSLTNDPESGQIKGQLAGWVDASKLYHFNHFQKDTRIALSTTR